MVRLTKNSSVTDKVVITTNGSLLHPEYSRSLIDAGLDELIISIEALSNDKYAAITGNDVDVYQLVENTRYFFEHRGSTRLFVKAVDLGLDGPAEERTFHDVFDPISDLAYIENIIPQFKPVDYEALNLDYGRTIYGEELRRLDVCPMIFYAMQIAPTGNICPCCVDFSETVVFGNAASVALYDIWNSRQFNDFRKRHLRGERKSMALCADCDYLHYDVRDEDILDQSAQDILHRMGGRQEG
jgi:radical SAM protein with 4Fe4S-binding SPASM domain